MQRYVPVLAGFVVLWAAAHAVADGRLLREARAENGAYLLQIEPGRGGRVGKSCQATLMERSKSGRSDERRLWEHPLVNDVAPAQAFVRNDGRLVVTLDEYRRGGARNALVIYGAEGELLRHFVLSDLLEKADWPHVESARREIVWLKDARCSFDDKASQFVVRLAWGREVRIDLKLLRVVRRAGAQDITADAGGDVPPQLLALLLGHLDEGEQPAGTSPGELAQLTPEEQARQDAIASELAATTAPSEPPADISAVEPGQLAPGEPAQLPDPTAGPLPRSEQPLPPPGAPLADVAAAPRAEAPWETIATAMVVPPPDPAVKTDYLTWLNDMGRVDGVDANPLYEAAAAQLVKSPVRDTALFTAALAGDPAALRSPEIAAYLAANADALATFHDASQCGAKGWTLSSPDGTMLGVTLPSLAPMRDLARLGCLEGRRLVAEGQPDAAAPRFFDTFSAGAHVGNGATLIENLVGIAMQAAATEALLDMYADPAAANLDYTSVAAEAAAAARPVKAAPDAVQLERAFFLDTVQRIWTVDSQTGATVPDLAAVQTMAGMFEGDNGARVAELSAAVAQVTYEDTVATGNAAYDTLTEALAQPYPQAAEYVRELNDWAQSPDNTNPVVRTMLPALSRYAFAHTRGETNRRAVLLVTELQAYRQQHGEYPTSLDALGRAELATDPFSAAPFVYRRQGSDFVLYSIAGDGKDDGGTHDRKGENGDLVYWPRPK